jgi:hypothetical protein
VLHWERHARRIWKDSKIYVFDAFSPLEELYQKTNVNYNMCCLSNVNDLEVKFYQSDFLFGGNSIYKEKNDKVFPPENYIAKKTITLDKPTVAAGNNILIKFNGYIDQAQLNRLTRSLQTVKYMSSFPASLNKGDIIRVFKSHNTSGGTTYAKDVDGNPIIGPDNNPVSVPFVDDGSKTTLYSILNVAMPVTGDPSAGNSADVYTPTDSDRSNNYNIPGAADTNEWIATALRDASTPTVGMSNPQAVKKTYEKTKHN